MIDTKKDHAKLTLKHIMINDDVKQVDFIKRYNDIYGDVTTPLTSQNLSNKLNRNPASISYNTMLLYLDALGYDVIVKKRDD